MSLHSRFEPNGLDRSTPNQHNRLNSSIMSQPRNNSFVTPTRSTFRRYSLADTCSTPISHQKRGNQHIQLSTRIDSSSPGFSSRVVQYNEEREKSQPTHQPKYDKLGVFPIVHFFKKDLPFLKRKAADFNTSPVSSSDLSKLNTPEQNRMLLEKIIKTSPQNQSILSHKSEPNTKSVLDALKEISRKRIHANGEDFIMKDDGKRMLGEYDSENLTRKRMRQNTSGDDFIALNSSRYSSIDELVASHSSMEGYCPKKPRTDKVTPESTPVKSKPVATPTKYVSVETQTIATPLPTPTPTTVQVEKPIKEAVPVKPTPPETRRKKPSPVKVFDETPLEAMRRNRLTALMGTSTPIKSQSQNNSVVGDKLLHKPLVSILSGGSKSPQKSSKHVTFDIPDSTSQNVALTASASLDSAATSSSIQAPAVTRTSSSVVSPVVTASVVESKPIQTASIEVNREPSTPVSSKNDSLFSGQRQSTTSSLQFTTTLPPPTLNFSSPVATPISASTSRPEEKSTSNNLMGSSEETAKFMFNSSFNKPTTPTSINSNQPQAGFKFDLKETTSAAPVVSSTSFSFIAPTTPAATTATSSSAMFSPVTTVPSSGAKPTFSFGSSGNSNQPVSTTAFADNTSSKPFGLSSTGSFSFNNSPSGNLAATSTTSVFSGAGIPISSSNTFGQSSSVSKTSNSAVPTFGNNMTSPSFAASSVTSTKPMFSFSTSSNPTATVLPNIVSSTFSQGETPKAFSLGATTTSVLTFPTTTTQSAKIAFGSDTNTTTTSSFNKPNNSFATTKVSNGGGSFFFKAPPFDSASRCLFGQNAAPSFRPTSAPSFGATTSAPSFGATTSAPSFGMTTAAPTFGAATTTPSFGATAAPTFASSAPNFGANPAPSFGATTTTPSFGATPTPSFGTTAPSFGSNNNASSGNSAFSNVGATSNNMFGGSGGFGSSSSATAPPSFGSSSVAAAASGFGSSNGAIAAPSFGSSSGATAAPSFGSSSGAAAAPGFGSSSGTVAAPNFGSSSGTAAVSGFGSSSGPGAAPSFGSSTTNFATSNFGSNEKSGFGTNLTTEKSSFAPAFGSSSFNNGFGATTTTSGFGTNTNTFSTAPANFGSTGGVFGQTNNNSSFGASAPFDKSAAAPSAEPNPFGGGNTSFGSPSFSASNPQPAQGGIFAFGSNASNKPPVFSFGASEPPKPSFNFQAANASTPNMFASSNPPAFGSAPPQFNVPPPSGSMFNIGTGGSSNPTRSRPLHKAKRRT